MKKNEMPVGFGMALAQNPKAMEKFALMSEEEKKKIIAGTHAVNSKEEMHRYVSELAENNKKTASPYALRRPFSYSPSPREVHFPFGGT